MPHHVAGLCDASHLIASAHGAAAEMLALICSRAPATEVALAATVLRDLIAELDRLRLVAGVIRDHGDERYADGVEDGIAIGRAEVLAEQAAENRASAVRHLQVVRPRRDADTGPLPVTRGA